MFAPTSDSLKPLQIPHGGPSMVIGAFPLVSQGGYRTSGPSSSLGSSNPSFKNAHRRNDSADVPYLPRIQTTPSVDPRGPQRADSTRVTGRSGIGFRFRGLASPGGAGSHETSETSKSSLFSWKGKAKAKAAGNASTYGAPTLTRTDTVDTTASSIHFLAPRPRAGFRPLPLSIPDEAETAFPVDSHQRAPRRLHKLGRPPGIEFGARMPVASPPPASPRSTKSARRASLSGFAARSDLGLDSGVGLGESSAASIAKLLRRRSSYEPIALLQQGSIDSLDAKHSFQYKHDDETRTLTSRWSADTPLTEYPAPVAISQYLPSSEDDSTPGEIFTSDDADNSVQHTISSRSPSPMRFHSYDSDSDDTDSWARGPTSTRMRSVSSRTEILLPTEKRLPVPFRRARLSWAPEGSDVRTESEEEWSGEWNRGDIRDVICSLRELKL
ncbi:hypothetical protein B0H17DRAFT_1179132 [Mycena rosella]|uniref:Uncharacterized protein n=1 Tax=Mycena rosella TaxID=1033263 RepID=A0AAD7DJ95_MYCRO|nr:hypothetical protein B0H17DRAFT_1179132 [Mycena rosella]